MSTQQMNFFDAPFSVIEVQQALSQLSGDTSPRLDGLNPLSYQKNWNVIGQDLTMGILDILNGTVDLSSINDNLIVLIPKKSSAFTPKDFRPINLCSNLYKIVAKAIANRLKAVLGSLISPNQGAFLSEHVIFNNVFISQEVVHAINHRKQGKLGWVGLKLDIEKAFDRVEWAFLSAILHHFHFPSLTSLIRLKAQQPQPRKHSLGIKIVRTAPPLSHLFFADDSLLFSSASPTAAAVIKQILTDYSQASGQLVNFTKSTMFFSPNTNSEIKTDITTILDIPIRDTFDKYLGLPQTFGRTKKDVFNYIKDRVWFHLNKWNSKFFSKGGLLSYFPNAFISYIPRRANEMAHSLAKKALGLDQEALWTSSTLAL
uniref:Reverse transcriptase domain-containing protein n=1 Tax=Cannabis sativa TaxID=3483 RepID=A0A803Q1F6_CANSA